MGIRTTTWMADAASSCTFSSLWLAIKTRR
jgi:hypothetical protein